jgi:hypothetical protein
LWSNSISSITVGAGGASTSSISKRKYIYIFSTNYSIRWWNRKWFSSGYTGGSRRFRRWRYRFSVAGGTGNIHQVSPPSEGNNGGTFNTSIWLLMEVEEVVVQQQLEQLQHHLQQDHGGAGTEHSSLSFTQVYLIQEFMQVEVEVAEEQASQPGGTGGTGGGGAGAQGCAPVRCGTAGTVNTGGGGGAGGEGALS